MGSHEGENRVSPAKSQYHLPDAWVRPALTLQVSRPAEHSRMRLGYTSGEPLARLQHQEKEEATLLLFPDTLGWFVMEQ